MTPDHRVTRTWLRRVAIRQRNTPAQLLSAPRQAACFPENTQQAEAAKTGAVEIADIAEEVAGFARRMGYEPRVAMLAYSTFGHPAGERSERVQEAVKILDKRRVDFEYDGEMAADVALNADVMKRYPFCRLSGPANVLVMPAFHSASISTKMLQELGGSTVIGPLLVGLNKPVQIVPLNAKDSDIVNMAAIAAYSAGA